MLRVTWLLSGVVLSACASRAPWQEIGSRGELGARDATVVYFELAGRDLSDRMVRDALHDRLVLAALERGGFHACRVDGSAWRERYAEWVGSGEGMGVVVLDASGRVFAARPGPQDASELAAYLDLVASRRAGIDAARAALAREPDDPARAAELGERLLELGCRHETRALLRQAAEAGVERAALLLARLAALDGDLQQARVWLARAPAGPQTQVTAGYVLFKERRHDEAAATLRAALDAGVAGDEDLRARLFLGKALHECGREQDAVRELQALIAMAPGSTFAGAALHTLQHIRDPDHGHRH